MINRFLITGLPRTRTAWFAAYFSACGYPCIHEGMKYCDSIEGYESLMGTFYGNSDCGGMFLPKHERTVIIERKVSDVFDSLMKIMPDLKEKEALYIINTANDRLNDLDGLRVKFEDINDRLQEIHEYCVLSDYNPVMADQFKNMSIELIEPITHKPKILEEWLCLG